MEDNFDYLADAKKIWKNKIKFKSNAFLRYLKDKLFYWSASLMDAIKKFEPGLYGDDAWGVIDWYDICLSKVEILKEVILEFNKQLKEKN
ncbi:hypothetical protein [Metamycoplasma auris]|uniref:Uncharacterized protein n=1 Tax=Metamycoplasma auris TaxID=51363 RepID=A0A2W7G112_9BACT|nr:hypothetical protein [Metamycoplasma auris]PZV98694.1 hypothetical protein BCF89_1162 [Metamycoplasma auris]